MNRPVDSSDHADLKTWPLGKLTFDWQELNQDFGSNPRNYREVTDIAKMNGEEELDLRLCMIERPFLVSSSDKF